MGSACLPQSQPKPQLQPKPLMIDFPVKSPYLSTIEPLNHVPSGQDRPLSRPPPTIVKEHIKT